LLRRNSKKSFSLQENSEAFINPEISPILAGDSISSPTVCNLVNGYINSRFVADDDCGRGKSEEGVLHSSERETNFKLIDLGGMITTLYSPQM